MRQFEMIVDTREKKCAHIIDELERRELDYFRRALKFGDYSFILDDKSYETEIVIERKGSLTELAGNLTKGRIRFENEFQRANDAGCKIILLIENGSVEDIELHKYRSKLPPKIYLAKLRTLCYKYQIQVVYVNKNASCETMLKLFKKYIREENSNI